MGQRIEGALVVAGRLTPESLDVPDGAVDDDAVEAAAGIAASKLEHQYQPCYSQESGTTVAVEDRVIHVVRGVTGIVTGFSAGCVVANIGDSQVSVDLYKNGASMLSSAILIDSGDAAYAVVEGTVDPAKEDVVADDVLEVIVLTVPGTGTLGKGVFAEAVIEEDAA